MVVIATPPPRRRYLLLLLLLLCMSSVVVIAVIAVIVCCCLLFVLSIWRPHSCYVTVRRTVSGRGVQSVMSDCRVLPILLFFIFCWLHIIIMPTLITPSRSHSHHHLLFYFIFSFEENLQIRYTNITFDGSQRHDTRLSDAVQTRLI
jgi:hypothetical protein